VIPRITVRLQPDTSNDPPAAAARAPVVSGFIWTFTFDWLLTTMLFVAIALAAALMPTQNDTFWQLRAGREMWRSREVLLHDTFSHTVYGAAWPNHEWLSQVILYAVYAIGGLPLVTLTAAAAVVCSWWIVWRLTPGSARTRFVAIAAVVAFACGTWSPRPQVFSLLLLATTLALLRTRRYGWLPPLFLLWANLHGGVALGAWLLIAALAASTLESPRSTPRLLAACVGCALAACVTPLGWRYWIEIADSLGRIKHLGIDEWAPPGIADSALIGFWAMLAAFAALLCARGRALWSDDDARQRGHLTLVALALALVPAALGAVRNVPPFLMAAVPAVVVLMRTTARTAALPHAAVERPLLNLAIATTAVVAATITVVAAYAVPAVRLGWRPLPAESLAKLAECRGNLYNRYDEGGFLIWFAPDRKVFLDGRQDPYPTSLIADQIRAESTGDVASLLNRYDIRCAYMPTTALVTSRLLEDGWIRLYRDARWTVLARRDAVAVNTRLNAGSAGPGQ
jgi:hypothetical protein